MWNKPCPNPLAVLDGIATATASFVSEPNLRTFLLLLIKEGRRAELASLTLPQSSDISVLDRMYFLQVVALFSKNSSLDFDVDTRAVGMSKWLEAEDLCRETNIRLRKAASDGTKTPPDVASVLHSAQRKIAALLGPDVPCVLDARMVFTSGASTSVQKRNACSRTKLDAPPQCSANLYPLLEEIFQAWPLYAMHHSVPGSVSEDSLAVNVGITDARLEFVPKNAKTDRAVMVEPPLNLLVQAAYGDYIRRKLRRVGIDLKDQSLNRGLAREASLTGALATLDLSSASDTISKELVAMLLPLDWFLALNTCRSPVTNADGVPLRLEKFSSMGNGFTFPLQSLIFWALVSASADYIGCENPVVSVYGDDIICPVEVVPLLKSVFDYCGFVLNESKSYWEGPFRESCGGDYYLGINIRPLFVKEAMSPKVIMALHNYVYRRGDFDLATEYLTFLPEQFHTYGPDGYGDGHLLGDYSLQAFGRDRGWGGWIFDTWKETGTRHGKPLPGDWLLPAYSVYVSDGAGEHAIPESRKGVKTFPLPGVTSCKKISIYTLIP